MKYTDKYSEIFSNCSNLLREELETAATFMDYVKDSGHKHSWSYLSIIAGYLTAYNELSPLPFFFKMKHFK